MATALIYTSFLPNTVEHDFNGHVINGIHEVNGKKCYYRAFHLVNKLYDFTGMLDLSGNFCLDDFFRKTHARHVLGVSPKNPFLFGGYRLEA